jgi:hypothetical protein
MTIYPHRLLIKSPTILLRAMLPAAIMWILVLEVRVDVEARGVKQHVWMGEEVGRHGRQCRLMDAYGQSFI